MNQLNYHILCDRVIICFCGLVVSHVVYFNFNA